MPPRKAKPEGEPKAKTRKVVKPPEAWKRWPELYDVAAAFGRLVSADYKDIRQATIAREAEMRVDVVRRTLAGLDAEKARWFRERGLADTEML